MHEPKKLTDMLFVGAFKDDSMNLKNFEEYTDEAILKRGLQYYKGGHVDVIEFDGTKWVAEAVGSEVYTVTVTLNDSDDILDTECDCPYDWGEYCKHQAAVFFALRSEKNRSKKQAKAKKLAQGLEALLRSQDKAALVSVLLEYANQDRQVKDDLLFRFAQRKDKAAYVREFIRNAIYGASRHGFVEYGNVYDAIQGAVKAIKIAEEEIGDALSCVSICIVILREMMGLLSSCDDSSGHVGGVISETIELINKAVIHMPGGADDARKLSELICSHACEEIYRGWSDWRIDLLRACIPMCSFPDVRCRLEEHLVRLEADSGRYTVSEIQALRCSIIEEFDSSSAADSYREQNLDNSDFRKRCIQKAIEANQLDRALTLCLDGEKADAEYRGLVSDWKHLRYTVYEKQNHIDGQKELALTFVMWGEFPYYEKLKILYTPGEWPTVLQDLLHKMEGGWYSQNIYEKILIHENLTMRLLEYCKRNITAVVHLYPHMLPECKASLDELFLQYIRQEAERASGRSHYRQVCDIIRHYIKACGARNGSAIKNELLEKYPRRPAFADELRKVRQA